MNKVFVNAIKNILGVGSITTIATILFIEYVKHYEKTHRDKH